MKRLLLLLTFFNAILFSFLTPIWHGPDEQAHFAQVQHIAETGKEHLQDINNLSLEIYLSEKWLGTERDKMGKNQYTHRPQHNLAYTQTLIGEYESRIQAFPFLYRLTLVKRESTRYPPLFYYLSAAFYRLHYQGSLIDRVFVSRFASILMGVFTVYFALKLARLVFPKNQLTSLTAAMLVSFQPMFSFLTASVNSDNLMNLLFTIFLFHCALIIKSQKVSRCSILILALVIVALKFTKPHFVIALPIVVSLIFFIPLKIKLKLNPLNLFYVSISLLFVIFLLPSIPSPEIKFAKSLINPHFPHITLLEHLSWTLRHTIAEVVPWYWGVFKWLSVSLPRVVNRTINRILIVAVSGLLVWFVKLIKFKTLKTSDKQVLFLISSSLIYYLSLMLWDWLFRRQHAFSFGMQGRYYFPLLSAHMILLTLGLSQFLKNSWLKLLGFLSIALNFIGLHTVAKSYYYLTPLKSFMMQLSQYKPLYFKYPYFIIWVLIYALLLIIFIVKYANLKPNRSQKSL